MTSAAKYADLRRETSSAFDKLGSFLADLCEGSEAHDISSEKPNLDNRLGSFYQTFTALKGRHADQNLTVAVLALTKSGKSTLLNALIGANCLPANNVPETARITRITHALGCAELVDNTSGQNKIITGEEDIKSHLRYLNTETRTRDHLLSDEIYLDLKIPIAALKNRNDETAPHDVTIRLLDTPGPNEAGEIALKAQVERLLDSVDAVIYLLDYTKLKTADEAEVLQRLKEINPQLMARLSQRLFFVVNKADMIETSEGLDAESTKQYVAQLITHQMQDTSFQLKPDQVLLISAQQALLSRLVLQGKPDKDVALRFGRLAFGSRAKKFSTREHKQAAEEMLADSGLAELEETVLAFLYAHSGSLKLLALLDDIVRMLQQIKNVAAASNAALHHDVAALQKETEEMQRKLEQSLQSFDAVQQEAQAVEGEVVDEVQQRMQRLKEKLFRDVSNVLEPSRQHPPGRWQEAWHRAGRFLNRRPGHSEAHQLELQNKLYELHAAISSSIEAEVRDFWQDVETATNERQRAMFQCINRRLDSLSRQIEATVGDVLDLRLEPVTIAMDPPAAQDFHDSLQNLFAQGIRQRSVTRNRQSRQSYTVWEPRFRNGLCRTGQYFVGRPASRRVTEQYEHPVYDLQPQHIKEYFIALVDGTIEASVKYVREYVHAYLSDMLEEAHGQIQSYGQSFNTTMLAALSTRQQGEEARSAALQVATARLASANSLLHDVAAIQRHAEELCPGQHSVSDVISEFSTEEPECGHAVEAERGLDQAESSQMASAAAAAVDLNNASPCALKFAKAEDGEVTNPGFVDASPVVPPLLPAASELFEGLLTSSHSPAKAVSPSSVVEADSDNTEPMAASQRLAQSPLLATEPQLRPAGSVVAAQESPLPSMMSELQQAMAASVSSNGSAGEGVEGSPLDEQTQLELALFLSLQDQEQGDAPAAGTPSQAAMSQAATSQWVASGQLSAAAVAAAAAAESGTFAYEAQAEAAALEAEAAPTAAAAHAESAATTAAAEIESAALAAASEIESGTVMAAAQAESAATAAATKVAARVEAAARSVDAALNTQAASVRGTVLSFADQWEGWWRTRQGQQPPRGPLAARGQAEVQGDSPAPSTQDSVQQEEAESDSVWQEEAELGEAAEQLLSNRAEEPRAAVLPRIHSVSSDDSSFEWTVAPNAVAASAPSAGSAPPVDQFAALSLLDVDRLVPDLGGNDSPFAVCQDVQTGMPPAGHADQQNVDVPVIPWDENAHSQTLHGSTDAVPISYPQVHGSGFASSTMRSESPIHYPQVHRPISTSGDRHQSTSLGTHSPQPASPRTQMHVTALGSDLFGIDSIMTNGADENGAHETGNAVPAEDFRDSRHLQEEEEPVEAPASIHIQQEHAESGAGPSRLAALSGHAEMSHDSEEWELVSSDLDAENV